MKSWAFVTTPYAWCVPRSRSLLTTNSVWSTQIVVSGRSSSGVDASTKAGRDRKSTRLNSSHLVISYAVFCLKKKKKKQNTSTSRTNNNKQNQNSDKLTRTKAT